MMTSISTDKDCLHAMNLKCGRGRMKVDHVGSRAICYRGMPPRRVLRPCYSHHVGSGGPDEVFASSILDPCPTKLFEVGGPKVNRQGPNVGPGRHVA